MKLIVYGEGNVDDLSAMEKLAQELRTIADQIEQGYTSAQPHTKEKMEASYLVPLFFVENDWIEEYGE